jgi:hypothetical protein
MGLFGAALAARVLALLFALRRNAGPTHLAAAALQVPAAGEAHTGPGNAPAVAGQERSRLADGLNSPSGDVHSDLRLVNAIFLAGFVA